MASDLTLEQALQCSKCKKWQKCVTHHHDLQAYDQGEISIITCCNYPTCKEKPWFYCKSCKRRFYTNVLKGHAASTRHIKRHAVAYPSALPTPTPQPTATVWELDTRNNNVNSNFSDQVSPEVMDLNLDIENEDDMLLDHLDELLDAYPDSPRKTIDPIPSEPLPDETTISPPGLPCHNASVYPKISQKGNEWLVDAFKDTPRASQREMEQVFARDDMKRMKSFWLAELATHDDRGGGGIMYLVAKAFQQCEDASMIAEILPDIDEALFQFLMLIQYQSMNDKQKKRQVLITRRLAEKIDREIFLKESSAPQINELSRLYGSSSKYSMWLNLPYPEATNLDGVAYIRPKAIIAFALANAIPVDDIIVSEDDTLSIFDGKQKVNRVRECRKAVAWCNNIKRQYYGKTYGGNTVVREVTDGVTDGVWVHGAPISNVSNVARRPATDPARYYKKVLCLWVTDWQDGFGPGKVKNNRNSVDLKTITISPPPHLVNSTDNTFPVAIGLKKASGWRSVQRAYYQELHELMNSPDPIPFYHGGLQKVIPVFIRQMASITDKMERDQLTSTVGCGSQTHRCFGVSGKVTNQPCDVKKIQTFIKAQEEGKKKERPSLDGPIAFF